LAFSHELPAVLSLIKIAVRWCKNARSDLFDSRVFWCKQSTWGRHFRDVEHGARRGNNTAV